MRHKYSEYEQLNRTNPYHSDVLIYADEGRLQRYFVQNFAKEFNNK